MTDQEYNKLYDQLWVMVQDYSSATYSLPRVAKELIKGARDYGYQAGITDDGHRDYKIITVEDRHFILRRVGGWVRYDLVTLT